MELVTRNAGVLYTVQKGVNFTGLWSLPFSYAEACLVKRTNARDFGEPAGKDEAPLPVARCWQGATRNGGARRGLQHCPQVELYTVL